MTPRRDANPIELKQMTLPMWPEHIRGVPSAALYSALFAPIAKGARKAVEREEIAAVGQYSIVMTGFRFDQGDLDVLQQLLHLARAAPEGKPITFKTREMLTAIGRSTGNSQRMWLLRSLSRMKACDVEISKGMLAFSGSLIANHGRDDTVGMHYVLLDPGMRQLFDQGYSQVRWSQRLALSNKPLAQWLHGFVSGQTRPLTWRVDDLQSYAGSNYGRRRDFRAALEDAAGKVRDAGDPVYLRWGVRSETVTISREVVKDDAQVGA